MLEHRVSDQVQARTTHRRLASIALRVPDVRVLDPVAHGTGERASSGLLENAARRLLIRESARAQPTMLPSPHQEQEDKVRAWRRAAQQERAVGQTVNSECSVNVLFYLLPLRCAEMSKRVKESDGSPVSLAKKLADEVDRAS